MKSNKKHTYSELENQLLKVGKKSNQIEQSQNFLFQIINNIGDPTFVKDDQSRLLIVNNAFCEIFKLKKEEIIGNSLVNSVPKEERESFLKIDKEVIETGKESIREETLSVQDGQVRRISTRKTRFINEKGEKFIVGVIHDITERYKAENELKIQKERAEENENRFRILMLNMEAGVIVHAPDTSIVQNNIRACEIFGLSDDELKGKTVTDFAWNFYKPDKSTLPFPEYPINRIVNNKTAVTNQILGLYLPDIDNFIWLSVNGFPVLNKAGEIIEIVTVFIDITERKIFEEAQIKHQRLKAIGEMSSSIAHDFNNSLQEMMGNLEIVKIQGGLSDHVLERINNIGSIIKDVAGRVSALQKFGDTENDDKNTQLIDFNKLIEDSLKQSQPLWKDSLEKEGLKINLIIDFEKIPKISCNSGELKSAVYNLIKNSIEAMPKGGDLTIKTGIKGDNVLATFTDTGIGMDEETQLKIFEPFFTTKGFKLGRGLGMSGVYSIVKKYKGDIAVKSSGINQGASIEIIFPISDHDEITDLKNNKLEEKKINNVLWVDDNSIITKSARLMVESVGHKCNTVKNGEKALEYLNNNICDIVFTDIGMPVMNGKDLAKAIKQKFGNKIKIVAVTGWSIEAKDQHLFDYVMPKPFTLESLKKTFVAV